MLRELHISGLAIIDEVHLELSAGLNVFTGQTGAGKSLILGALELLLGLRGGGQDGALLVRPGRKEARISGLFEIADPARAQRLGEILDLPIDAADGFLITRRVSAAGRSSVAVNGSPVTVAMLREAGQFLVDIHGQHDQQFLLKPANQILILDAFAGTTGLREQFADTLSGLRRDRRRLEELSQSRDARADRLELYRFQLDELDAAALQPGEYDQVKQRYVRLQNVARLGAETGGLVDALAEGEDTVVERLGVLGRSLRELARLDAGLSPVSEGLATAEGLVQDVVRDLLRYQDRLDVDEGELAEVEARLDLLNRLIHKYARDTSSGGDPVAALLAHRDEIARKAKKLAADTEDLEGLADRVEAGQGRLTQIGAKLTAERRKAARKLKTLVEKEFRELEMPEAKLSVSISPGPADEATVNASGLDDIEFLVQTNPGQENLPLRKIASGGEMSRIMLALKTILADKDQVTVLVFDEIDANIGDRLGATIGRKLRALAGAGAAADKDRPAGGHQVLCITHLSQIAACGDHHLRIAKDVVCGESGRETVAGVEVVTGEARVGEIAEMMAGADPSATVLAHARDLLERAAEPVSETHTRQTARLTRPSAKRRRKAG